MTASNETVEIGIHSSDAGKSCTDSDQCDGDCYTDQIELPPGTEVEGVCSGGTSLWGREIKKVEDGKIVDGPAVIVM